MKSRQEQKVEEGVKAFLDDGEVVLAAVVARPRGWTRAGAGSADSYENCTLFLVPEGREPSKVSFLPYDPATETEFVYWDVG